MINSKKLKSCQKININNYNLVKFNKRMLKNHQIKLINMNQLKLIEHKLLKIALVWILKMLILSLNKNNHNKLKQSLKLKHFNLLSRLILNKRLSHNPNKNMMIYMKDIYLQILNL